MVTIPAASYSPIRSVGKGKQASPVKAIGQRWAGLCSAHFFCRGVEAGNARHRAPTCATARSVCGTLGSQETGEAAIAGERQVGAQERGVVAAGSAGRAKLRLHNAGQTSEPADRGG